MIYTSLEDYKKWLKLNLTEERYEHSLGTAECAKELAKRFGLDEEKAYFAGLIHDCAKCFPNNELKETICKCDDLCEGELINPKTYHAPAGKILAQKEFCVNDEEILSSIRWHTLGKLEMTDFEKIIFLADKIETRTRPQEWIKPIQEVLEEENGLNKALLLCYANTIKSLVDRNLKICKTTIDIYNNLLETCF
ncbi:MAG: bis(5'-nucleosyl)-tetraphosphatase (symmetrical) YqeK [bacterium]|nr:bis(5'-nucleosyl)-tetraphosphatase (symmetrical) YqeK [bacterium]